MSQFDVFENPVARAGLPFVVVLQATSPTRGVNGSSHRSRRGPG
jgi:hypothetical protein